MSIATLAQKRASRIVGVLVVLVMLCYLASPFICFLANYTIRFVDGQHLVGGSPIHDASRMPLPSLAVEPGPTLCCRMELCDFRFPLPKRSGVMTIDSVSGGGDTIKGTVYVTNANGGTVDLHAYASLMRSAGFRVSELYDHDSFSACSPDGGCLQVDGGQPTKIAISFFGDF
jgi:hypothetical protein